MTKPPLDLIYPVILVPPLALLEASSWLCNYIMMSNFNHNPTSTLFIAINTNLHDLVAVLMELIHPLDSKPVLGTNLGSRAANDYLY